MARKPYVLTLGRAALSGALMTILAACGEAPSSSRPAAVQEVMQRQVAFPDYPAAGRTYLSFSQAHGFQVNFIVDDRSAWLWYPGNRVALPETYRLDHVKGVAALCWQHPENTYNPVIQRPGGNYVCQSLDLSRRTIVSVLPGDPFKLATGRVPYPLQRCSAPPEFTFYREEFGC